MIFNIYHVFALFVKLQGCRFLYIFSLCDIRNEAVFLILEHASLRGLNRKNMRKNMKCWSLSLYYKRSDWKSWLSERFSETLISKLRNKKNTCRRSLQKWSNIELYSSPMVLLKIFDRSIYGIATWNSQEKIKVGNTTWGKVAQLDWSKMPKQFSLNSRRKFCQYQATRWASTWSLVFPSQIFTYFPAF